MKTNPSIKLWEGKLTKASFPIGDEGDVIAIGVENRRIFILENGQWVERKGKTDEQKRSA